MSLNKLILIFLLLLLVPYTAQAHPIRPAVVTVQFHATGTFTLDIETNLEAWMAGIGPQHADTKDAPSAKLYDSLREKSPTELERELAPFLPSLKRRLHASFDDQPAELNWIGSDVPAVGDTGFARLSKLQLRGEVPRNSSHFSWQLDPELGNNVLKIVAEDGTTLHSEWLKDGARSRPFDLSVTPKPQSWAAAAATYTWLGFTHIVPLGLDHMLFVLGIFLLSLRWGPLLWQVTAFTIAHSITLGLAIYGIFELSPRIVEPLIALSIVYVGVENLLTQRLHPWRIGIVFLFGLLHGLGFAGVLTDIGLPPSQFVTALITFNLGVELGQLAVIAAAWVVLVGWLNHRSWYRRRITLPLSLLISLIGGYWFVTRLIA